MHTREFSFDPVTGIRRFHHYDPATELAHIETVADVTDIVETDKFQFNSIDERANWKGDLHKVASIPMSLYFELKAKGILDDQKALRKWLNSSDNRVFRTRPGEV